MDFHARRRADRDRRPRRPHPHRAAARRSRLRELEADADWFDRRPGPSWPRPTCSASACPRSAAAAATACSRPRSCCEQVGRTVAPVPLLRHDRPRRPADRRARQRRPPGRRCCRRWSSGDLVLTAALAEGWAALPPDAAGHDRHAPTATAGGSPARRRSCRRRTWPGASSCPAATGDGESTVFVVDPSDASVVVEVESSTNLEPLATSASTAWRSTPAPCSGRSARAPASSAGSPTARIAAPVRDAGRRLRGRPAPHRRATRREREQFGTQDRHVPGRRPPRGRRLHRHRGGPPHRPPGGVAARRGPRRRRGAGHRQDRGRPTAPQRVVHAAQHLHGGIGVDVDYPVHRYFRWARHVGLALGGSSTHLRRLGDLIAAG